MNGSRATSSQNKSTALRSIVSVTLTSVLVMALALAGCRPARAAALAVAGVATATAAGGAGLRVTVSALPRAVPVGRDVPYTIRVANVSDRPVPGVVLVLTLTGLARIVTATSTRGTCRGFPVTCEVGRLARDESETVNVVTVTETEGPLTVRATVTAADRGAATTARAEVAVLDAPGALSVVRYRPRLVLEWTHSGRGITGFEIERKDGRETRVGRVGPHARRFEDGAARAGRAYVYRVRAVAASGASAYSTELIVTIAPR